MKRKDSIGLNKVGTQKEQIPFSEWWLSACYWPVTAALSSQGHQERRGDEGFRLSFEAREPEVGPPC